MKTRLLFLITLTTFLLSGFLGYKGLEPFLQSAPSALGPVPLEHSPLPSEEVLGENVENLSSSSAQALKTTYLVTKVVDGDTIYVSIGGHDKAVRLIGVDTPETVDPRRPVGCFGKEASDKTKELLTGKTVILEKDVSETDKYQRLLRYVYLPVDQNSNLFVNDYLIREGYAKTLTYPPDVKFTYRFKLAEKEARENQRGLWGSCQ